MEVKTSSLPEENFAQGQFQVFLWQTSKNAMAKAGSWLVMMINESQLWGARCFRVEYGACGLLTVSKMKYTCGGLGTQDSSLVGK